MKLKRVRSLAPVGSCSRRCCASCGDDSYWVAGRRWSTRAARPATRAIVRLALRNAARHPSRSTLTIGLVASAAFLIMAISAFHLEPPSSLARRDTGTGGFALVGESSLPLLLNLNDEDGRFDLGFSDAAEKSLTGTTIFPLRAQRATTRVA